MKLSGEGGTADHPSRTRTFDPIAAAVVGQQRPLALAGMLALSTWLRFVGLDGPSLWYDELVSYRVAATATPADAIELLRATDATGAPLHPLLLQAWYRLFGATELAGRASSSLFGVAVVAVVFLLGRRLLGIRAAWYAAALASMSPPLVYYSRELRMYSLLVFLACLAWLVAGLPSRWTIQRQAGYLAAVVALGYTHPLACLMIAALAAFAWIDRPTNCLTLSRWVLVHAAAGVLLVPALVGYTDHAPTYEEPSGRSFRLLLGFPIGFVGGNFVVLAACVAIIAYGLISKPRLTRSATLLAIWLLTPVLLLYALSWLGRPLFGPVRYTLFVAPAYLLLLGQGLSRLPRIAGLGAVLILSALSAFSLRATVFTPGLKADWRAAGAKINEIERPGEPIDVAILVVDRRYVGELEVARHYLGPRARVRLAGPIWPDAAGGWLAVGLRDGQPAAPLPLNVSAPPPVIERRTLPGLLLLRAVSL